MPSFAFLPCYTKQPAFFTFFSWGLLNACGPKPYYSNTTTQHSRFQKFITSVLNDKNSSWKGTRFQQFEQEVYDDLAIHYNVETGEKTDYSNSVNWIQKNFEKFAILNQDTNHFPSFQARKLVAESFIHYVEQRA